MKVILTMDVPEVGTRGDRLDVAAGYARNYLLPRRLAVRATSGNERMMAEEGKLGDVRDRKARREAEKIREFLEAHELFSTLRIGREGKAFGAITAKDIEILLRQTGLEVDRRKIGLPTPIKRLGVFGIPLHMHADVDTIIQLSVDREGGSAEGAASEQAIHDAHLQAEEEAAKAEAEARALRQKEAEEATQLAIEKAAARRAREEEEAKAREERLATPSSDASDDEGEEPASGDPDSAERSGKADAKGSRKGSGKKGAAGAKSEPARGSSA